MLGLKTYHKTGSKGINRVNILFDIDGCLADFVLGFTREAVNLGYLKEAFTTQKQQVWSFDQCLTPTQQNEIWNVIYNDPWWWTNLPALVSNNIFESINNLQLLNQVIFCTTRPGKKVQLQTKTWLSNYGVDKPSVVVSKRKGETAKALEIDYSLDDKLHNANCIYWMADAKPCRSYLLNQPYNKLGRIKGVRVVNSVGEFLTAIKEGE